MTPATKRRVDLLAAVALAGLLAALGALLWQLHRDAVAETRSELRTRTESVEAFVRGWLRGIDLALLAAEQRLRAAGADGALSEADGQRILADVVTRLGAQVYVRRLDAHGRLLHSSAPAPVMSPTGSVADRSYFRAQAEAPGRGMFVSEGLVSRLHGRRSVVFSRRVDAADGRFDGVVIVGMPLDVLQAQLETFQPRSDATIFVADERGPIHAQLPRPDDAGGTGPPVPPPTLDARLLAALRAGPNELALVSPPASGGGRLWSVRRLEGTPWIVGAGATRPPLWGPRSWVEGALAGATLSLALGIGWMLRRLTAALVDATARKAQLRAAFEALDASQHGKDRFLSALSHELRTPMNGLSGAVQLWQGAADEAAAARRFAPIVSASTQRLERALADLFEYAEGLTAGAGAGRLRQPVPAAELSDTLGAPSAPAPPSARLALVPALVPRLVQRLRQLVQELAGADGDWRAVFRPAPAAAGEDRWHWVVEIDAPALSGVDLTQALQPFAPSGLTERAGLHGIGVRVETLRLLADQAGATLDVEVPGPGRVQLVLALQAAAVPAAPS